MAKKLKSPGFKLYVESFVVGTMDMTAEEIGGYILLLCYQWDKGEINPNETQIKAICKTSEETAKKILQKFSLKNGVYINERLEIERNKQAKFSKQQSAKGIKGGRPKKAKQKPNETQTKPPRNPSISISNITNTTNVVLVEDRTHSLADFVQSTKNVSRLPEQLDFEQCEKLIAKYPKELIQTVIGEMENKKDLTKKYNSVYLTINSWCRMALQRQATKQIASTSVMAHRTNSNGQDGN